MAYLISQAPFPVKPHPLSIALSQIGTPRPRCFLEVRPAKLQHTSLVACRQNIRCCTTCCVIYRLSRSHICRFICQAGSLSFPSQEWLSNPPRAFEAPTRRWAWESQIVKVVRRTFPSNWRSPSVFVRILTFSTEDFSSLLKLKYRKMY